MAEIRLVTVDQVSARLHCFLVTSMQFVVLKFLDHKIHEFDFAAHHHKQLFSLPQHFIAFLLMVFELFKLLFAQLYFFLHIKVLSGHLIDLFLIICHFHG